MPSQAVQSCNYNIGIKLCHHKRALLIKFLVTGRNPDYNIVTFRVVWSIENCTIEDFNKTAAILFCQNFGIPIMIYAPANIKIFEHEFTNIKWVETDRKCNKLTDSNTGVPKITWISLWIHGITLLYYCLHRINSPAKRCGVQTGLVTHRPVAWLRDNTTLLKTATVEMRVSITKSREDNAIWSYKHSCFRKP